MLDPDPQRRADGDDRFRLAMASAGIGMAIVDLQGRWVEVNPAPERLFGLPAAEITGRTAASLTHPDDIDASASWLRELASGERLALEAQKRYLRGDGSLVWAQVNVAVMPGPDGRPAYLIAQLRDITGERAAHEAQATWTATLEAGLAERNAALERMNRQEELFAYGVSHDLRAPLRTIEAFSARLESRNAAALDDEGRGHLTRIRAAAGRMGTLIDALLELSRVSRSVYRDQDVDLSLLAEWVGAELQDAHPGRAALVTVQPGLRTRGDERHLKIVLDQLLGNAWRFSAGRERVEIDVSGEVRDGRLHLAVRDAGSGFDMRYAQRLFEPFQRMHGSDDGAGHGLGLAIAQRIVERHGGQLHAESQPGQGSVFHLELAAAAPD